MVRLAAVSSEFQRARTEVCRALAKMENVKGVWVHKIQLLLGKGLTPGPEVWIAIPSRKLGNYICIDWCLSFSFSQTLFPAAWMFWQSLKFSFTFYALFSPVFILLSSWHQTKPNDNPTRPWPLALDPLVLRPHEWELKPVLFSASPCIE